MTSKKKIYNSISLSNLHKKKLYYITVLNVLVLPMFMNINFQLPNTYNREEICKRLALDVTFYMEEKKVEPENTFPVFPASLLSSFSRKFFENRHFSSFPVFPARLDTLLYFLVFIFHKDLIKILYFSNNISNIFWWSLFSCNSPGV